MTIRTILVEDEPLAIDRLRTCLAYADQVDVIGEAHDGRAAVEMINTLRPDLLFLDVQLPLLSGFDVLRSIQTEAAVIFTTAHDEYAVHAFEWGAFDYLVKPFDHSRVLRALDRYMQRSGSSQSDAPIEERLNSTSSGDRPLQRFFVKHRGVVIPLQVAEILYIKAADDYSAVSVRGAEHLVHLPLREFARKLDSRSFRRVHRSALVNVSQIRRIEQEGRGALLHMSDGARIQASRNGLRALRDLQL